jgi:hypothetical protein
VVDKIRGRRYFFSAQVKPDKESVMRKFPRRPTGNRLLLPKERI